MSRFGRRRRALLLTALVPGLGHSYLRQWTRGALWAGSYLLTLVVFSPYGVSPFGDGLMFVFGVLDGGGSPLEAALPLSITGLSLLDVYARFHIEEEMSGRQTPT